MNFVPQTTNYSCVAASVSTGLSKFGIELTEAFLMDELGTKEGMGTDLRKVETWLKGRGLSVIREQAQGDVHYSCFEELEDLEQAGYVMLLEISYDVPHCVVFQKVNHSHITVYDPWQDKLVSFQKSKFKRSMWRVDKSSISPTVIMEFNLDLSFLENTTHGYLAFKPNV